MRKYILLLIVLVCVETFAATEKIKSVVVTGEYTLFTTSSITFAQAEEFAREDARRKALEQVCPLKISAWDKLEMTAAGESFTSLSVAQIDGEIYEFNVLEKKNTKSKNNPSEWLFTCKARVKVKIGVEPDPNFVAAVKGIHAVYYDGEAMQFTVKPSQDCYLKIFLFVDAETGYQIFPNQMDQSLMFNKDKKVKFPISEIYDFVVTKDTDAPIETNRLVFVFTKQERPFYQQTLSRGEIEKWMAKIPNDEKFIVYSLFDIRKK